MISWSSVQNFRNTNKGLTLYYGDLKSCPEQREGRLWGKIPFSCFLHCRENVCCRHGEVLAFRTLVGRGIHILQQILFDSGQKSNVTLTLPHGSGGSQNLVRAHGYFDPWIEQANHEHKPLHPSNAPNDSSVLL